MGRGKNLWVLSGSEIQSQETAVFTILEEPGCLGLNPVTIPDGCVTLGKLLSLSVPPLPQLLMEP